jgi:hypothetical protein
MKTPRGEISDSIVALANLGVSIWILLKMTRREATAATV